MESIEEIEERLRDILERSFTVTKHFDDLEKRAHEAVVQFKKNEEEVMNEFTKSNKRDYKSRKNS